MKVKRYVSVIFLALFLGILSSLWVVIEVHAQQGRIDAFTYFIPYLTEFLDDQFNEGFDQESVIGAGTADQIGDDIETTISIAVYRTGTVIYYDHWELRGLEANLTSPIQVTGDDRTLVWGDGDTTNGVAPTVRPQGGGDSLLSGDVIVLQNEVVLDGSGNRDENEVFFDGGDMLTALEGAIAVTMAVWPIQDPAYPPIWGGDVRILYAGAWELYSTNQWGTEYIIPIGENLDIDAIPDAAPHERAGFEVVGLNVQAAADGTEVTVDLDGENGPTSPFTVVLDQGEQFIRVGNQDGIDLSDPGGSDPTQSVLSGTYVRSQDSDHPIQVHVLAANPDRAFEARAFTIVPRDQWTDSYLAPRSSDGDYWLYNPHSDPLVVTANAAVPAGPGNFTIPPGSTVKYPSAVPVIAAATGIHFTADQNFYGVVALDELSTQDWGYALQPVNRLSSQTLVGWGAGNNRNPPSPDPGVPGSTGDESPVYVTALDDTRIYIDLDNDGNDDGFVDVSLLAEVPITDTNHDLTGAFLYTDDGTPFATVWGQDAGAPPQLPSMDLGTSIIPLSSLNLQKTFELISEADCNGTISEGDTVHFSLKYFNNSFRDIPNVTVEDFLPSTLDYIPGSTRLNGGVVPDAGNTPFPLDEGGLSNIDVPGGRPGGTGSITFDAIVNDTAVNRAEIHWQNVLFEGRTDSTLVLLPTQADPPLLLLDKTLIDPADGMVTVGQAITFSLTITNSTNSVTITKLPLENTFNEDYLSFRNAEPPETVAASGVISWTDLTTAFGPLTPGQSVTVLISFTVDQVPPGNDTTVRATALNAERDDGQPPLVCYTDADVTINPAPTPTPTPTSTHTPTATPTSPPSNGGGGGDDDDDGDGDGESPPPPTATATPTVDATAAAALPAPPQPTPALPVTILPETGLQETTSTNLVATGALVLIVGGVGGVTIFYVRRRMKRKHLS